MEFVKMNESGTTTIGIKELNDLIYADKYKELINDWIYENDWEFWNRGMEELSIHYDQLEYELEEANKGSNS